MKKRRQRIRVEHETIRTLTHLEVARGGVPPITGCTNCLESCTGPNCTHPTTG